VNRRNYL